MAVEIRILRRGDEAILDNVALEVFDAPIKPALAAAFLADPRHHLAVAIDDGTVVGFVSAVDYVHPDKPPQLWINEVGVAPSHRRQGIARRLMGAIFDVGRARGCREAWVGTEESNVAAMGFYSSLTESRPPQPFVLFEFDLERRIREPASGDR